VACRHYLAAGDQPGAVRLLDRSVLTAVGTGAWGQAAEIVSSLKGATAAPDVEVLRAQPPRGLRGGLMGPMIDDARVMAAA
jgi:hypothetical protein